MVTLVTAYNGTSAPNTTAALLDAPSETAPFRVQLTKNGVPQEITFTRGTVGPLDATASNRGTFNDIAFDSSNRLHLVYADRDNNSLMYAVRSADGKWNTPSVIDPPAAGSADGAYQYISNAIDNTGNPAVAYFDGWNGDLKYAFLDPTTGKWKTLTVDSAGSTGLYPSLAFGRDNKPVISYYNRTNGDLRLAQGHQHRLHGFSHPHRRFHRRRRPLLQPRARPHPQDRHPLGHRLRGHRRTATTASPSRAPNSSAAPRPGGYTNFEVEGPR
jgi:hypothetical protein